MDNGAWPTNKLYYVKVSFIIIYIYIFMGLFIIIEMINVHTYNMSELNRPVKMNLVSRL